MEDILLVRFIERKCSEGEAKEVLNWIEQSDENKSAFIRLQTIWAAIEIDRTSELDQFCVDRILQKVRKKRMLRNFYWSISACAAAILLLIMLLPFTNKTPIYDYEALLKHIPSSKDITLIQGTNSKIELTSESADVNYYQADSIIINDTLKISRENKPELNTLHIPYGKRSRLVLADGTLVFLNSGSTLIYPSTFGDGNREVYLDGEAYFDVRKAKGVKFLVKTAYKTIEVLGTQFNVSVDKETKSFEAVLVNGRILLNANDKPIELAPNQYYSYSAETSNEQLKRVDVADYISWKDGRLRFKEETMASVLRKLEKIYNIKVTLRESKYLTYTVSGNLNLQNTPEETLDVLMSILVPAYKGKSSKFYQLTVNK